MLGRLAEEFGPDRVVPVAFHVDYFNDPWKDPHSDARYSRREWQYSTLYTKSRGIKNESYLYLTPLVMVDGRVPMVGSNADAPARARAAIREGLARPAEVSIEAQLQSADPRSDRALTVRLRAQSPEMAEREVLLEVVTVEDGLSTKVLAGELEGRTYTGRFIARDFAFRSVVLPREGEAREQFRIALPPGARAGRTSLAILIQDEQNGEILQARTVSWEPSRPESDEKTATKNQNKAENR